MEVELPNDRKKVKGLAGMVNVAVRDAVDKAGAGAKAAGAVALRKSVSEDALRVKHLRKFMDLNGESLLPMRVPCPGLQRCGLLGC